MEGAALTLILWDPFLSSLTASGEGLGTRWGASRGGLGRGTGGRAAGFRRWLLYGVLPVRLLFFGGRRLGVAAAHECRGENEA